MGVILLFFWSHLGLSLFSKTYVEGVEGDFCGQEEEGGLVGWALMPLLDYLEGKK